MGAITFDISLAFYFFAMLFAVLDLSKSTKTFPKLMLISAFIGFGFQTVYIFYEGFSMGRVPFVNPHEATSFFAWCIFLLFFILEYRYKVGLLGAFITPMAFLLMFVSFLLPSELKPLSPVLRSQWLGVHTVFAFLANAAFAMAAGVGFMYMVQEHYVKSKRLGGLFSRLPSLHVLDEINYRLVTVGFPLFTVAIISGSIWADNAWGSYISWDPRQIWALVTWLIFGIVLHARLQRGWRGKRAATLSILGFLTIIGAFAGLALLQKGQHVFL